MRKILNDMKTAIKKANGFSYQSAFWKELDKLDEFQKTTCAFNDKAAKK